MVRKSQKSIDFTNKKLPVIDPRSLSPQESAKEIKINRKLKKSKPLKSTQV